MTMSSGHAPTVDELLRESVTALEAAGCPSPRLDAELLLAHATGRRREWLFAHPEYRPSTEELETYDKLIRRRSAREPVAYILGRREFWSMDFEVTPAALVPRPETELLVELATRRFDRESTISFADAGTGSGCIAAAVATELPLSRGIATDTSPAVLEVARRNLEKHGLCDRVEVIEADLLSPCQEESLDLVISNPPYVPSGVIDRLAEEVRLYEPRQALDGGPDGLRVIRRLLDQARTRLRPGGILLCELGSDLARRAVELCRGMGYRDAGIHRDLAGSARVLEARAPCRR